MRNLSFPAALAVYGMLLAIPATLTALAPATWQTIPLLALVLLGLIGAAKGYRLGQRNAGLDTARRERLIAACHGGDQEALQAVLSTLPADGTLRPIVHLFLEVWRGRRSIEESLAKVEAELAASQEAPMAGLSAGEQETTFRLLNEELARLKEAIEGGIAHAAKAGEIARSSGAHVDNALVATQEAEGGAQLLSGQSQDMKRVFEELTEQARQIGLIVGSIQDVAKRTNLLALNAAIEAARAGEAGRGFAVVADEVRQLSDQANASSEQIAGITKALFGKASEAADGISQSLESISQVIAATMVVASSINEVKAGAATRAEVVKKASEQFRIQLEHCGNLHQQVDTALQRLV
ncbi:hypothetical protein DLREEDagrD3_09880 [Denitratisoma sp. agr-D3]